MIRTIDLPDLFDWENLELFIRFSVGFGVFLGGPIGLVLMLASGDWAYLILGPLIGASAFIMTVIVLLACMMIGVVLVDIFCWCFGIRRSPPSV